MARRTRTRNKRQSLIQAQRILIFLDFPYKILVAERKNELEAGYTLSTEEDAESRSLADFAESRLQMAEVLL